MVRQRGMYADKSARAKKEKHRMRWECYREGNPPPMVREGCLGCCNKEPPTGQLNNSHLLSQVSGFWRLEVQDQGVSRVGFF